MGYRQQHFVIAKVGGRYRVIACIHHQWMFGRTSLRQMLLVMAILSNKSNQIQVKRELAKAEIFDKSTQPFTFPFIATALVIGSSVHDEGHYSANVKPQLLDTKWNTFPNDDGMVVYDITYPQKPRYGFVWLDNGVGQPFARYRSKLGNKIVLDAKTYISGYYPEDEVTTNNIGRLLAEAESLPLLAADALNALWPDTAFKDSVGQYHAANIDGVSEHLEVMLLTADVVREALAGSRKETASKLSDLVSEDHLPDLRRALIAAYSREPDMLRSPDGVNFFAQAVTGDEEIDLTPFKDIEINDIMTILRTATTDTQQQAITLYLPDLDTLTAADLKLIVQSGIVKGLHLGRTRRMKLKEIVQTISGSSIQTLSNPLLWPRASHMTFGPKELAEAQHRIINDFPRGTGTQFPLTEIFYITSVVKPNPVRLPGGGLKWTARTNDQRKSYFAALPIQDALMPLEKVVEFAPEAISRLATTQEWSLIDMPISRIALGIAKKAAMDADHRISPLPGRMYSGFSNSHYDSERRMPGLQAHRPGEWTMVVCHERPRNKTKTAKLRFAFFSLEQTSLKILNAKDFLAHCGKPGLESRWDASIEKLKETMTSLQQAPESQYSGLVEIASKIGVSSAEQVEPYTTKDVEFGLVAEDELIEAMTAVAALMQKPNHNQVPGFPVGTTCKQN